MRKVSVLSNGLRVVSKKLKDRNSAALGVWIASGGRYENAANKGIAHFLEHMVFKGSRNYSCDAIKQSIEGIGGSLNAFTGEEETCYYAKVPALFLPRALDVLSDIVFYPKIAQRDLEKERTVILEEIKMYHDLPQYYVMELLEELLWPNHPLGQSLAGSPQTVSSMKAQDLKAFHQSFYQPNNIVIAASGDILHDDLVDLVEKRLNVRVKSDKPAYIKASHHQNKPNIRLFQKATEQMHVALGYLAYPINHPDYYTATLLSIILGGNMSSRLFNEVREKRGLAYSVSSGLKSLDDTGCFIVRAGVDNSKLLSAVTLILTILEGMAKKPVLRDEFKRARDYYLGQFKLGLEDTMDNMLWVGGALISNDQVKTIQEVEEKINKVTPKDIMRVAKHILNRNSANLAVIGPMTDVQKKDIGKLFA